MIIAFAGHGNMTIDDELKHKLSTLIEKCIKEGANEFLCGGYGNFDICCAYILKDFHQTYHDFKSIFVTPYIHSSVQKNLDYIRKEGLYDEIVYPELEKVPKRIAISKRNEWMINRADTVIVYGDHDWGGAWTTLQYAKRKKKRIINLANRTEREGGSL